jgi:Skp family chaperone for outer membrane proteins
MKLANLGAAALAGMVLAQAGNQAFRPPRTAVVDIYEVFENYDKKNEVESRLQEEAGKAEAEFKNVENRLRETEEELKLVAEGTPTHDELIVKRTRLQIEIKNLQKSLMVEFQEKHLRAVGQIRDEIATEIERFARSRELDLIVEKRITADANPKGMPAMKWPIVHFARTEIDITDEIVRILNQKR